MKRLMILGSLGGLVLIAVYAGITVYDESLRYGRMWETPVIRPHEEPIPDLDATPVPVTGGESFLRRIPEKEFESQFISDLPESILLGKKRYGLYCIHCHGKSLDGRGSVGQSFSPLATDLRDPRIQRQRNKEIFNTISYGKLRMPPLAQTVEGKDRLAIISYLRSEASGMSQ
ncbi:MAG: cytochrome c [Thermodesulfobacteriota bacterium]